VILSAGPSCYSQSVNSWFCRQYIKDYSKDIRHAFVQHVRLSALILVIAIALSLPLALLALRSRWMRGSILSLLGVIYTIPSLALFVLLQPVFGVTHPTPVIIALIAYAQLLLVRNVLVGLEEVPPDVLEAARGTGYGPVLLLLRVRIPMALPAILAGIRLTAVSTISLLSVGGLIGQGGLGQLILDGQQRELKAQVLTGVVLIVVLALVADLILLLVQRVATPWARVGS
jgi:osmoprotectant transport system permease protein